MPKRHDALIPLTHDHHHALAQARSLIEASSKDETDRSSAGRAFLRFYQDDTLLHFHEEEEILFPRLLAAVDEPPPELVQVLVEHVRIHGLVRVLREQTETGSPSGELLKQLAETLRAHIRLEESKLFPLIEQVAATGLADLEFAQRDRGGDGTDA